MAFLDVTAALTEQRNFPGEAIASREMDLGTISKKRVLFIPASIRSHIIPTLYLADLLADEYDIQYAVANQVLADIVSENGFMPVMTDQFRMAVGMEQNYLISKKRKAGFWQIIKAVCTNEIYEHRKQEIARLIDHVKPEVIIIDIFNSTDFLALYEYRTMIRLLFCNPMLSTYRIGNLPIVSEGTWPQTTAIGTISKGFDFRRFIQNPRGEAYGAAMRFQWRKLQKIAQLSPEYAVVETPFVRLFKNIPEVLLAPLEFELSPEVKQSNQHYLGLCIREQRIDTELDADFVRHWPTILTRKQAGKRIIYCSFGTFYTGSDKALLEFVTSLLEAMAGIPDVQLVCSVNSLVVETLKARQASVPNVHFFKRVPQLAVLKSTSVHITHGGLGSVKESILYGVPILVYPLDLHYDQNGNGLKIEHHGIGLRGVFGRERSVDMRKKIVQLLEDATFRTNIDRFRKTCTNTYANENLKKTLTQLSTIPLYEPNRCREERS